MTSKNVIVITIFAAIFSIALLFSLKGPQTFLLDSSLFTKLIVYIGTFLTLFYFVIAIIFLALKFEIPSELSAGFEKKNHLLCASLSFRLAAILYRLLSGWYDT